MLIWQYDFIMRITKVILAHVSYAHLIPYIVRPSVRSSVRISTSLFISAIPENLVTATVVG